MLFLLSFCYAITSNDLCQIFDWLHIHMYGQHHHQKNSHIFKFNISSNNWPRNVIFFNIKNSKYSNNFQWSSIKALTVASRHSGNIQFMYIFHSSCSKSWIQEEDTKFFKYRSKKKLNQNIQRIISLDHLFQFSGPNVI